MSTSDDLEALQKRDLVRMAADRGLSTWGTKQDLIDRITSAPASPSEPTDRPGEPGCGCSPGQSCGRHLPVPAGWPADLPPPDLEIPRPAPPITPTGVVDQVPAEGEVRRMGGECLATVRVGGRGHVDDGVMGDAALIEARGEALSMALAQGIRARAPRLVAWLPDGDTNGRAVFSMIIKGG